MDFSTINIKALKRLPVHVKPPSYFYQDDPGNGCFLDPPGYPTYFTRNVYTRSGNSPSKGADLVITYNGVAYVVSGSDDSKGAKNWDEVRDKVSSRIRRLWNPLPLEHPRTQAWIDYCVGYFKGCYVNPETGDTECGSGWSEQYDKATLYVQEWYPEYEYDGNREPGYGKGGVGSWWERLAERPTPETCPGESWHKHPVNGSWCQVCSWSAE